MAIRIKARAGETAEQMLRRFKKLCEKEGLTKDIKKRQHYEKPSERRRRAARRTETRGLRPLGPQRGPARGAKSGPGGRPSGGGRSGGGSSGGRSGGGRSGGR